MRHSMMIGIETKKSLFPFFSLLALSLFISGGLSQAAVLSSDSPAPEAVSASSGVSEISEAKIVSLEGDVKILKKGSDIWQAVKINQTVDAGDQILTGENSSADIAYDSYLLNISHIKEKTKAEIRSINPTDIYLEDGSIFSALDGLSGQGGYQIATPTAVAAVRGTHFDVGFDKTNQKFTAASLPTGETDHVSKIIVSDPEDPYSEGVEIVENKQFDLKRGDFIRQDLVRPADPARLEAGQAVFSKIGQRLPQFQERRIQGKAHLQEMKQRTPQDGKAPLPHKEGEKQESKTPFKENQNPLKNPGQPGDMNSQAEKPSVGDLENVRAFDALLEEDKPQHMKPFGSFKPQPQSGVGGNTPPAEAAGQNPENQNAGQAQKLKPFGEMRPQSINAAPGFGKPQQNQNPQGFHQPPPQAGGPQNNGQPPQGQGNRQGPPPKK